MLRDGDRDARYGDWHGCNSHTPVGLLRPAPGVKWLPDIIQPISGEDNGKISAPVPNRAPGAGGLLARQWEAPAPRPEEYYVRPQGAGSGSGREVNPEKTVRSRMMLLITCPVRSWSSRRGHYRTYRAGQRARSASTSTAVLRGPPVSPYRIIPYLYRREVFPIIPTPSPLFSLPRARRVVLTGPGRSWEHSSRTTSLDTRWRW